jgi:hypothetical protein
MAKAKKTETKEETKPAAKAPAAKAKAAKPAKAQSSGNAHGIDTNLLAQVAAMAVGNKAFMHERQDDDGSDARKETSTFKQLKESLAKPGGSSLSNLLHAGGGPEAKKSNLPFTGGKQIGRNQTFGADVAKSGVPRRTPG